MMIKVGDEYLDYDEDIIMEKQAKLFQDISSVNGDFSYSFSLPKTAKNLKALGYPLADIKNKSIYNELSAIIENEGMSIYSGYIRVQKINRNIECSFFSGNNNWFSKIEGNLSDLNLSSYDEVISRSNIITSFSRTEGFKYTVADPGGLQQRGAYIFGLYDFVPIFFISTLLKKCFIEAGFKIDGELMNNALFRKVGIALNDSNTEINKRALLVYKNTPQAITTETIVTFDTDSPDPYFIDTNGNFDLLSGRYTADVPMTIKVTVSVIEGSSSDLIIPLQLFINGVFFFNSAIAIGTGATASALTATIYIYLDAGDYLEIKGTALQSGDTLTGVTLEITPSFLYKTFIESSLPKWTKQKFVSNILKAFNVIPHLDAVSNTVTLNLFDKILSKDYIDISNLIQDKEEVNFTDLTSDYYQINVLRYSSSNIDEVSNYDDKNDYPLNSGNVLINNFYLEKQDDILTLDFSSSFNYYNDIFKQNIEKIILNEYDESSSYNSLSVNNVAGKASLVLGLNYSGYAPGDLIRISDSSEPSYNGDWIIESLTGGSSINIYGLPYVQSATTTVTKLTPKRSSTDNVFWLVDTGPLSIDEYSHNTDITIASPDGTITTSSDSISVGFLNLPDTGLSISTKFKESLSFENAFQLSLIDQHFNLFKKILNDPVIYRNTAIIPLNKFNEIDFLRPVFLKSETSSGLYYVNKITGYVNSYTPCDIELIKLSV